MRLQVVDQARVARLKLKRHREQGTTSGLSIQDVADLMDLSRQVTSLEGNTINGAMPHYLAN